MAKPEARADFNDLLKIAFKHRRKMIKGIFQEQVFNPRSKKVASPHVARGSFRLEGLDSLMGTQKLITAIFLVIAPVSKPRAREHV